MFDTVAAEEMLAVATNLRVLRCATECEQLLSFHRIDEAEAWRADGCTDLVAWIGLTHAVSRGTARAWALASSVLAAWPVVAEAFSTGSLSFDQLAPLGVLYDDDPTLDWIDTARTSNVAQLVELARARRERAPKPVEESRFRLRPDATRTGFVLTGRLTSADGELVLNALDTIAERAPVDTDAGGVPIYPSTDVQHARALVEMATTFVPSAGEAPPATMHVHVDSTALFGLDDAGLCQTNRGLRLDLDVVELLSCDGRIQLVAETEDGSPVGIGRASRKIPWWLQRQLHKRDPHCQFPGCQRDGHTHGHHITHWTKGGPTDLDNLVRLCHHHHRLVHLGGWRTRGTPTTGIVWIRPNGQPLQPGPKPPGLQADVQERYAHLLNRARNHGGR